MGLACPGLHMGFRLDRRHEKSVCKICHTTFARNISKCQMESLAQGLCTIWIFRPWEKCNVPDFLTAVSSDATNKKTINQNQNKFLIMICLIVRNKVDEIWDNVVFVIIWFELDLESLAWQCYGMVKSHWFELDWYAFKLIWRAWSLQLQSHSDFGVTPTPEWLWLRSHSGAQKDP